MELTKYNWKKITHDNNGNPRYVIHFLSLLTDEEKDSPAQEWAVGAKYALAVKRANKIGGRKFHNKQYGGGIVFTSYNLWDTERGIDRLKEAAQGKQAASQK